MEAEHSFLNKLKEIKTRSEEVTHLLSQPETMQDMKKYQILTREHASLGGIVELYEEYLDLQSNLSGNREIAEDPEEDAEIREMARMEIPELSEQLEKTVNSIQCLLLPKDPADQRNIILEIRAGTGGDEAALFARDLCRMYIRYTELQKWRYQILTEHQTDTGGYKEVSLSIEGVDVYSHLKFEGGVHRVQRVPKTETQGRIHTSAATVAVMPEAEELEIELNQSELRIDVYRSSGPGGQSVNTTDSAVRITHLPTGMVVICQNEKSQLKNRNQALKVLRARLYEQELQNQKDLSSEQRRSMVGSGDRSERIRTYNFPQGRLTDHRINLTLYKLEQILMGSLAPVIDALRADHQAKLLNASKEE